MLQYSYIISPCICATIFIYVTFIRAFLFFFFFFLGPHPLYMEVPRLGVESEPQQHEFQVTSVTYAVAHSNAGSLTNWVGPGVKPASLWILVEFVTTEPQWKLSPSFFRDSFHGHSVLGWQSFSFSTWICLLIAF